MNDHAHTVPGDFGWSLGTALRGYQVRLEEAAEGVPAGIRGFQILSAVVHRSPPNQQALGAHLGIDRTVLTYLLDTLAEAGLVERIPAPEDRRARKIVITDKGRHTLDWCEQRVRAFETELLDGLEPAEGKQLETLLTRLAMDIHRSQPGINACEAMDHLP